MEAKELRIGNWVKFPFHNEYVQVKGIAVSSKDYKTELVQFITQGGWLAEPVTSLKPIPLTEELLLKCGFEWDGVWLQLGLPYARWHIAYFGGDIDKMSIRQYRPPYENPIITKIDFASNYTEYLHQLQNLYFSLTGQELNIEL